MSQIWFCSDLHFGHVNISPRFRPEYQSEAEHRGSILKAWHQTVSKRDTVYVLGDAAFTMEAVESFGYPLQGKKFLVRGNHDTLDTSVYLKYFDEVYGLLKYKQMWLSHAPIHPDELRGKINLHGHVHQNTLIDKRYLNCCPENLIPLMKRPFISLDEVRAYIASNNI